MKVFQVVYESIASIAAVLVFYMTGHNKIAIFSAICFLALFGILRIVQTMRSENQRELIELYRRRNNFLQRSER